MLKNSEFQVQFEFKDSKFLDATITLHELYNENSRRNYSMGNTNFTCPQQWRRKRPDWEIKGQQWPRDVGPTFGPLAEENNTAT